MTTRFVRFAFGVLLLVLFNATQGMPATFTWYVAPAGSDGNGGTGWGDAFATISNGVAHAADGQAVWVSNGVYTVSTQISVTAGITVLGVGGRSNTVINGGGATRCLAVTHAVATVDGFTISIGFASGAGSPANNGGGIYMTNGTVQNCAIVMNRSGGGSYPDGAGIWMSGGTVQDCIIAWNTNSGTWVRGGGVMMNGNGLIQRCVIRGNATGSGAGGGVSLNGAGDRLRNCLVAGNYAPDASELMGGGGVGMDAGAVENCTVVRNQGIGVNRRNGGTVKNSISYFNVDTSGNSRNWRNFPSSAMTYTCTTLKPMPATSDDLDAAPDFVDPGSGFGPSCAPGNYHLRFGSPLIDAGSTIAGMTDDLDKTPRPQPSGGLRGGAAAFDIGAYEFNPTSGVFQCGIAPPTTNSVDSLTAVLAACAAGDPAVTNVTWYGWDFGAGQTPQSGVNKAVVTNTWGPGQYDVTLTVSNSLGSVTNYTRVACVKVVGRTAFVSPTGTNVYPYNSWASAATNIQAAVDAAEIAYDLGVTTAAVVVADGTYTLGTRVAVSRGIALRSANGRGVTALRKAAAAVTRALYVSHAAAVVDGFTVAGFSAPNDAGANFDESVVSGGGVLLNAGTVQNCLVTGNTSASEGGGLYVNAGTVQYCVIESNSATVAAGGMETRNAAAMVSNCVFRFNSESSWGGSGVLVREGGTVRNCLFYGNVSSGGNAYGPIFMDAGLVENCTLSGNQKGGLWIRSGGTVRNCIVWDNSVTNIYDQSGGHVSFTCAAPLPSGGSGNITSNPQFKSPGAGYGLILVPGDYQLSAGSPCVNAGTNQTWMTGATDLAGSPRILLGVVEMGAYEMGRPAISNSIPTGITVSSANINGSVLSTGASPTTVSVFWGPADAGAAFGGWARTNVFGVVPEGPVSTNVAIASNSIYYYRYYATNSVGDAWASPAQSLLVGEVGIVATDPSASEDGDPGLFTVSRPAAATNGAVTVNLSIGGTALNGTDYAAVPGTLVIPAGTASVTIAILPLADLLVEGPETAVISLAPGGYVIGSANSATVTIADSYVHRWYVAPGGSDGNSGTNWAAPFATISNAAAHAATGDGVFVSNGVYNVTTQISLSVGAALIGVGGWSNTVINGGGATRCLAITHAAATVDGFTISNGFASGAANPANNGGGIYMTNGTVQNCAIVMNRSGGSGSYPDGAGIWMSGGTVQDCTIAWNTNSGSWTRGGGVMMNGNGLVQRCVIRGNATGSGSGGGVSINGAGDRLRNCLIAGNYAPDASELMGGGGVGMDGGAVEQCTIVGNRGVGANRRNAGTMVNSILRDNVDTTGRPRNHAGFSSASMTYCCTTPPPLPAAADNLDADPQFVTPGSSNGTAYVLGDYHLRYGSAAIDAGTPLAQVGDDIEKKARPVNGRGAYGGGFAAYDMGAYEADSYAAGALRCAMTQAAVIGLDSVTAAVTAAVAGDPSATNIVWYAWDMGAGHGPQSGAAARTVSDVYGPGSYDVTLTVSNSLGAVAGYTGSGMVKVVGRTVYVAAGGSGVYPYNSWATAVTTLQAAVDTAGVAYDAGAGTNALVLVSNGTYTVDAPVLMTKGVTLRSAGGRDATVVRQRAGSNTRGFYIQDAGAVLDGFTISGFTPVPLSSGGSTEDGNQPGGAAVVIPTAGSGGTIRNCTVSFNTNSVYAGYGIVYIRRGMMSDTVVERNSGWTDIISLGDAVAQNCVVRYNSNVDWGGAGVTMRTTGAILRNCLFYGNNSTVTANGWGSVFMDGGVMECCTLTGNQNGGVYYRNLGGNSTVRNCIVYGNSYSNHNGGAITFTCATPLPAGAGNIASDPVFKSPGTGFGLSHVAGDYRIRYGSPAMDAGTNQAWMTNAVDLAGTPRIMRRIVDMGAYENNTTAGSILIIR